jgi:Coenzyme PQQ synthesis protein D (PqqD)
MNPMDTKTRVGGMKASLHLQPHPDVLAQNMGEETLLLHLRTERFYELNHTAARFWELLSAGHDLAVIQAQMLREFDVDEAHLADEIASLLTLMSNEDLVITHE